MSEPETMGQVPAQNKTGSPPVVGSPTLGERIAGLVRKRGPGRPKGSTNKQPVRPSVVADRPGNVERDSLGDQKANCRFFVETALFLFVSGDEFLKRALLSRLKQYVPDEKRLKEFELEVYNKYAFTEADKQRLEFLLYQLAIKYPLLQKVGPEIGLLVFVVQYGLRMLQLSRAVESLRPVKPAATQAANN